MDADGKAVVWSSRPGAIGDVILFENRGGAIAYSVAQSANGRLTLDRPALGDESSTLQKYGRFLYPIADREIAASPLHDRAALQTRLNAAAAMWTVVLDRMMERFKR